MSAQMSVPLIFSARELSWTGCGPQRLRSGFATPADNQLEFDVFVWI